MPKPNLARTFLIACSLALVLDGAAQISRAEEGLWSKAAFSIPRQRAFRVPSPDRRKTVRIEDLSLAVIDEGERVPGIEGYTLLLPAEIAWAPDSKAFVITANEGGAGEEAWFVTVYALEYERVNYHDVTAAAAAKLREQAKCPAEELNFGAIKWVRESKTLLIVGEIAPRADCPEKGAMWGYIVEVPSGTVLRELSPKKLVDEWGEFLGPRVLKKNLR
ncbi:MAG: hypothetical protein ACYC7L_09455 [Nitrospirota bacterium]